MSKNILDTIVESKKQEIGRLHQQFDPESLRAKISDNKDAPSPIPGFYQNLAETRTNGVPFFIAEFKRKSPSEGWINRDADLPSQIRTYAEAGAGAISVLTDEPFFGGNYADLKLAAETLSRLRSTVHRLPSTVYHPPSVVHRPPLLLQKDFILDPIQIYLAKLHGADIILLIAAILEPERLDFLKKTAESTGMGVLVEVHDAEELAKIQHLDFPVLGVNNRDLKTFRTALNRVNVLSANGGRGTVDGQKRFIISESGIRDYRDFQAVSGADGFLIGTGLMRSSAESKVRHTFSEHFQSQGRFLFKACGIRTGGMLHELSEAVTSSRRLTTPDYAGINFSPVSKRRIDEQTFQVLKNLKTSNAIAVFYKNAESEIRKILEQYPFRAVQLYAGDVTPGFVRSLKQRVLLAVRVVDDMDWSDICEQNSEPFATDVDFLILDGRAPGSGQRTGTSIPADFPYPFLLAGGLNEHNLEAILQYKNCIGVDIASGIETDGEVDQQKISGIAARMSSFHSDLVPGAISE